MPVGSEDDQAYHEDVRHSVGEHTGLGSKLEQVLGSNWVQVLDSRQVLELVLDNRQVPVLERSR